MSINEIGAVLQHHFYQFHEILHLLQELLLLLVLYNILQLVRDRLKKFLIG